MNLDDFEQSLAAPRALGKTLERASRDPRSIISLGIGLEIIDAARSGSILLSVARFENFLKDVATKYLSSFARATPPVPLSRLDANLQLKLIKQNFKVVAQERLYGVLLNSEGVVTSIKSFMDRIVNADEVWAGEAIDTHSNPGSETVQKILALLGVAQPWSVLEVEFQIRWGLHQASNPEAKEIPAPRDELNNIIRWRNVCAHTGQTLSIGASEVKNSIDFLSVLSASLDAVLKNHSDAVLAQMGSVPSEWKTEI